ncbi:DUF2232 domain-containing protein [Nodularia spumigena CS-584]|jgi:uncharacterized protein YybS (DUF2232 family)|uniref:DUF2232 domain-containing protein n=2 Tax=Nodularia spumigena TaxID=70799 RepID=A0A2S0Q8E8_NODSP|nr:DUF2232 domain-containing protein [Nodularia spumigena]AHJ29280.1 hypothetical protein NSP_29530 [Nodularia spumigena CCY9414]AVZ30580.1 hypothetical protein BMF81_02315 [Nodularia spumigena UHCC 0039]EAW43873.1 hypothetical protein N9414_13495 [Nodularia spumigena CCY9414]MDB9381630.1 DUF2232 domain-containing protein [Nodularia spumigena CS-584]MEA5524955.1 DUF2232 domain-containing protein [Nodularia spumigena UHCC 0143]
MSISDSLPDENPSPEFPNSLNKHLEPEQLTRPRLKVDAPLRMVETAFLASAASLIWFINFYFPLGPVLRIFFPVPIALVYLRWGKRAAWMAAVTSGLLLSVLMGPVRSLLFVMPFAFMGVLLGATWHRRVPWIVSITLGTLLGTLGVFFRLWLLSVLSGEDLWVYVINQVTELIEWAFLRLELLASPSLFLIQVGAVALIVLNNFIYLFMVHLAAWLLLDRLGNPIPRPPEWVQVLMDYEG